MKSARELARRTLHYVLESDSYIVDEETLSIEVAALSHEDRGLFQELSRGSLREWMFLDWVLNRYSKKAPSDRVRVILHVSAYQLLFLDRVPDYAIFSEAKLMGVAAALSKPEQKFVHGVLKTVQKDKAQLLEQRQKAMERLKHGELPGKKKDNDLDWAVLNAEPALVDALTVVDEKVSKKEARKRAVVALATMKTQPKLVGYQLPGGGSSKQDRPRLESAIAPRALILSGSELLGGLRAGEIRVQGEASQWVCEKMADELASRIANTKAGSGKRTGPRIRVLEMASGKGGKLAGTLVALTARFGGDPSKVPAIEWWAADISQAQLELLERDIVPLIQEFWPQVSVDVRRFDWLSENGLPEIGKFDAIWLDAPCTGFGTLAKLPQIGLKHGPSAYDEALKLAKIQKRLSQKALKLLAKEGAYFYTVCTLTRPETYGVVEAVAEQAKKDPRFKEPLWPGSDPAPSAEGFFAALF